MYVVGNRRKARKWALFLFLRFGFCVAFPASSSGEISNKLVSN